jgi:hypothetical protein
LNRTVQGLTGVFQWVLVLMATKNIKKIQKKIRVML